MTDRTALAAALRTLSERVAAGTVPEWLEARIAESIGHANGMLARIDEGCDHEPANSTATAADLVRCMEITRGVIKMKMCW